MLVTVCGGLVLVEFDPVMKSRDFSQRERMLCHASIEQQSEAPLAHHTLLAAIIGGEEAIDYFDAGVAAGAKALNVNRCFNRQGLRQVNRLTRSLVRNLLPTACRGCSVQLVKRSNLPNSQE